MATIRFKNSTLQTLADIPAVGQTCPDFSLTQADLSDVSLTDFKWQALVLNIFPSIDTPTCSESVRTFNKLATQARHINVLCISADLPFAQQRFCGLEDLERVKALSCFRNPKFGRDFGVGIKDGPLRGLLARCVIVVNTNNEVMYTELVAQLEQEPNYLAALTACEKIS